MTLMRRIAPYLGCLLVASLANFLTVLPAGSSQLRKMPSRGPLKELGAAKEKQILDRIGRSERIKRLEGTLAANARSIQYRGDNRQYLEEGRLGVASFKVQSASERSSGKRRGRETLPVSVSVILDSESGRILDYFLTEISESAGGGYTVSTRSDSLGLIWRQNVSADGTVGNGVIDASDFLGQDRGVFKLGYDSSGDASEWSLYSPFVWNQAMASSFDWGAFWRCLGICGVIQGSEALVACQFVCGFGPYACAGCIAVQVGLLAYCVWGCYGIAS